MKWLQGQLLAASPHMLDTNFAQSVILLLEHNDEGAFGVVLNRAVAKTVKELWEEVNKSSCENQQHLNLGGPVSGPLLALHTHRELSEMEVLPGVFLSAEREHLEELLQQSEHQFKLFIGHSGWGSGQLENELKQGAWLTLPATAEYIFHDEHELWRLVTRQIGAKMLAGTLRLKHVPDDPSRN
jgi:putative transcriptional regulator